MNIEELMTDLGVSGDEATASITEYTQAATSGLVATNKALKTEKRGLQAKLDGASCLVLDAVREALGVDDADLDELPALIQAAKGTGEAPKDDVRVGELERKLAKMTTRAETAETTGNETKAKLTKRLGSRDLETLAAQEISAAKGSIKALMPHVKGRVKTEIDDDGEISHIVLAPNGEPMEDAQGNPVQIKSLVDELRRDSDFAGNFEAPLGGTGAGKPGGVPNNKKWTDMDMDERSELRGRNPALADRLKAQAA